MSATKSYGSLTGLFAALLLVGCATDTSDPSATPSDDVEGQDRETDDKGETDEEERQPDAGYAGCSKGELESDMTTSLELAGPGVNPETGMITPGTYLVATTYLALQPGTLDKAIELSGPIIETSFGLPGFVAVTIAGSESCNTLRTITVWENEQAMFAFVASPEHARAMAQTSAISRGTSNTITWDGSVESVKWTEAARQLALEEDGDI